jgi:hypothetical protein
MYTDEIKQAFLNYLEYVDITVEENVKLKYLLKIIKEKLDKYNADAGDTIIANPIQDCYDTYSLITRTLEELDAEIKE